MRKNVSFASWGVLLGALGISTVAGIAACSNGGDDTTDSGVNKDSGVKDTGGGGMDTGGGGMDGGGDGGGQVDCGSTATLHPESEAGVYCPFSGVDGGSNLTCKGLTEHCCEPPNGTSSCKPIATTCGMTDTDWQCEDQADCVTGICCGLGKPGGPDPGCVNLFASGFTGSKCMTSCSDAGLFQICEADGQCPNGQKCKPAKIKGNQVGICQ